MNYQSESLKVIVAVSVAVIVTSHSANQMVADQTFPHPTPKPPNNF